MADNKAKAAAAKAAANKTPPVTPATPEPAAVPVAAQPDQRLARAAQPTPAIAGVTAPAGPSSLTPVAPQQVIQPTPFLSEGMRHDLEDNGFAIDPVSGARFDRDPQTGEVTMRERVAADAPAVVAENWGKPTTIDVAFAPQPEANDTDKATGVTSNPLVADQPVAPPDSTDPADSPARLTELDTGETLSYDPVTGVATAHNPNTGESREVSEAELQAAQAAQDNGD